MSAASVKLKCLDDSGNNLFVVDSIGGISSNATQPATNSTTGSFVLLGGLSIANTANATSVVNGGSLTAAGGGSFTSDLFVGGNLFVGSALNNGIASNFSGTFAGVNNTSTAANVDGFQFASNVVRSFQAYVTVNVSLSVGGNLYECLRVEGHQTDAGWTLYTESMGDTSGIAFTITNSGQVQYTSSALPNWSSTLIRYYATQIADVTVSNSATFTGLTSGALVFDTLQLNNTANAVLGSNNGALNCLGGAIFGRDIILRSTTEATSLTGGALTVSGGVAVGKRLTVGGNVGIGTGSPNYPLHVVGNIYSTADMISFSDRRQKADIVTIENALAKVGEMRGVYFTNVNTNRRATGVIAQEMQQVLPEVVSCGSNDNECGSNECASNEGGEFLGVAYGNIVGVLIEAIKELQQRVEELERGC
jgi:hypothetical protein